MSRERTAALLLRLYPAGWRARYGEELETLIVESSGRRVPWRVGVDVARAAVGERLRAAGLLGGLPPAERMRGGALLVLCAWAAFVVAGTIVAKFSEHWQAATPSAARAAPHAAFDALLVSASTGSALVVVGVAAALPELLRFVLGGGLRQVRRHLRVAVSLTLAAVPASIGVVVWAGGLTAAERNGHDGVYATAVALWALLLVASLASWTTAGVALARRLELTRPVLRLEALLAAGVATAMVAMTAATALWWAELARSAPWFLAGVHAGDAASPLAPQLLGAAVVMLLAAGLGVAGAGRALRAAVAAGR